MRALKKLNQKKGFTLVELLMALVLSIVVLGVLYTMYIVQQRNFIVGNSYIDIHKEARMAMDWLAKDIRWGIELLPSHGAYSTSNSCIVLKVPSIDSAGDVIDVKNDHDYFIYRLTGSDPTILERIVDAKDGVSSRADGTITVAENMDSLLFSYNGTGLSYIGDLSTVTNVDTELTIRKTLKVVKAVDVSDSLSTKIKFRNKE